MKLQPTTNTGTKTTPTPLARIECAYDAVVRFDPDGELTVVGACGDVAGAPLTPAAARELAAALATWAAARS